MCPFLPFFRLVPHEKQTQLSRVQPIGATSVLTSQFHPFPGHARLKTDCSSSRSRLDTRRFSVAFPAFLSARSSRKRTQPSRVQLIGALTVSLPSPFWGAPLYEADKLLPSVSLPSLGHSPSQRAGRSLLSGERKEEEEPLDPPPLYEQ